MKKITSLLLAVLLIATFVLFAVGSGESETKTIDQGNGTTEKAEGDNTAFPVEILSCRLAKDYEGKPVVIVKYAFTNQEDKAESFMLAVTDNVFQNGVGLNECIFVDESANYSSDNQTKEVQKGVTLEVEVAYVLNDATSDVTVELTKFISLDETKVTKTFSIA